LRSFCISAEFAIGAAAGALGAEKAAAETGAMKGIVLAGFAGAVFRGSAAEV
jgi:hypothetical protein